MELYVIIAGGRLRGWGCGEGLHAGWRQSVPGLGHVDGHMSARTTIVLFLFEPVILTGDIGGRIATPVRMHA